MADDIDCANDKAQQDLDLCIQAARMGGGLPATGECFNCTEPVMAGHKFCDANCRNDWQSRNPGK